MEKKSYKNKNIVHIGLGKTATTSLQKHVFTEIPKLRNNIFFNDPELMYSLKNLVLGKINKNDKINFKQKLAFTNHLISWEYLVNWNPRRWEFAADRNLDLFGSDTKIIITIRDSESYMRSLFQQQIHQGNICWPEEFLINKEDYNRIEHLLAPGILSRFDVDSFDLQKLCKLYTDRFSEVLIVPINKINNLEFLCKLFDLSNQEHIQLSQIIKNSKMLNMAYSHYAMKLTLSREKLLRSVGLTIRGTDLKKLDNFNLSFKIHTDFNKLNINEKILQLPKRLAKKIIKCCKWRVWMQHIINRVLPYKKYKLPKNIYRNIKLAKKNDEFIARYNE